MKTHHMSAPGAPATCKRVSDDIANKTTGSVRRDQWYPACVHVEADECGCRCHTAPSAHDKACCARCGFRTAVKP